MIEAAVADAVEEVSFEFVARVARAVAAAEQPAAALSAVLAALRQALGASGAAILQSTGSHLRPVAANGLEVGELPMDEAALRRAGRQGYPLVLAGRLGGVMVAVSS